jgi:hypothetical protein
MVVSVIATNSLWGQCLLFVVDRCNQIGPLCVHLYGAISWLLHQTIHQQICSMLTIGPTVPKRRLSSQSFSSELTTLLSLSCQASKVAMYLGNGDVANSAS